MTPFSMQTMLTLSFHSNALGFSGAKRSPHTLCKSRATSFYQWTRLLCTPVQLLTGEGKECQRESKDPGGLQNGAGSSGFDIPREIGPICLWVFLFEGYSSSGVSSRRVPLKVIATFPHLFRWLAQFDISDSPVFHTNGIPVFS